MSLSLPLLRSTTRYLEQESWKVIFLNRRTMELAKEDPFIWTNIWINNCWKLAIKLGNLRWIKHLLFYQDIPQNRVLAYKCAKYGILDILKYLYYLNKLSNIPDILHEACIWGQEDVIQWIHHLGFELTSHNNRPAFNMIPSRSSKLYSTRLCDLHIVKWLDHNVKGEWYTHSDQCYGILQRTGNTSVTKYIINIVLPRYPIKNMWYYIGHDENLEEFKSFKNHLNQTDLSFNKSEYHESLNVIKWLNNQSNAEDCTYVAMNLTAISGNIEAVKWFNIHKSSIVNIHHAIECAEQWDESGQVIGYLREIQKK